MIDHGLLNLEGLELSDLDIARMLLEGSVEVLRQNYPPQTIADFLREIADRLETMPTLTLVEPVH